MPEEALPLREVLADPTRRRPRHDLRLLAAALVAWAVTAVILTVRAPTWATILTAFLALGIALASVRRQARVVGLAAATTTLVLTTTAYESSASTRGPISNLAQDRASARVEFVTTGGAKKLPRGKFDSRPRYSVPVVITRIDARGRVHDVHTPVTLSGGEGIAHLAWRSKAVANVRLSPPTRIGQARAFAHVSKEIQGVRVNPVLGAIESARVRFARSMTAMPNDPAGLVPALVVGDTSAVPDDLNEAMNVTGMSHLNAVSGSNITIVLVAVLWVLARAGLRFRARLFFALVALAFYVALCHPDPSVVRAAAMGAAGVMGTSAGRPRAACPSLGVTIIALLLYSPWFAINAGFALSALATLGLILFASEWAQRATRRAGGRFGKGWEMLMIPVAAQSLCLPLLVVLSEGLCLVSVPANIAAEPLVAPATLGGMVTLICAQVAPEMASWLAWVPGLPAWIICGIARSAATVPFGTLPWPSGAYGAILAVLIVATLLFGCGVFRYLGRWGALAAGAAALIPVSFLVPLPGDSAIPTGWQLTLCDVGQGDAIVVRTGSQSAVMVDVGPPESRPDECLDRLGVSRLDAIVLTHYHADHVGALARVIDRTSRIFVTPIEEEAGSSSGGGEQGAKPSVDAVVRKHRVVPEPMPADTVLTIGDVTFTALWPRRVIHEGSVQNNASILIDVSAPQLHALLLGDAEKQSEAAIADVVAERARERSFDVVKVAHHGSGNQDPRVYQAAAAPYAAISVGKDNDYGHPSKKLLAMIANTSGQVLRTDSCQDVYFASTSAGVRPAQPACVTLP